MRTTSKLALLALAALPAHAQFLGDAPQLVVSETRPPAKAAATGPIDRASVVRLYHTRFLPAESVASGWTGSVGGCQPGTTSNAFKQAVLDRLNSYRTLVRLPDVVLTGDSRAADVQNAALMFSANSDLDHFPPNTWACYTSSGANGASHANIALGMTGFDAIDGYMDDFGVGNEAVGHRRWILFPPQAVVATGDVPAGAGPSSNALWTLGPFGTRPATPNGTAWPPRGYVPWDMLPATSNRWSFSYPNATFAGGVTVNGAAATLEPQSQGYGDNTIVFRPNGISYARPTGDIRYDIVVGGVGNAPSTSYSYSVTVIDAETLDAALAGDFNGDGRGDLVWRNEATGQTSLWLMNGTTFSSGATLMQSLAWRPALTGDFNGDGRTDLLWRNEATGETSMWLMNGLTFIGGATLLSDGNWLATHAADLDGNGSADIVWRNVATGQTALWLMSGAQMAAGAIFAFDGVAGWEVSHVADFDGDGRADLIARNANTGTTAMWRMNGLASVGAAGLIANGAWRAMHAGDLNGDGRADLVWHNASTGTTSAWLMNGTAMIGGATLLVSTAWRVVQTGDFNGDGRTDLVWRNRTTGQTSLWVMNGLAMQAGGALLTHVDWQPARIGNFDGNVGGGSRHDILWRNSRTGQHAIWLMNGLSLAAGANVLNGAAWWSGP
jgi:hypothetical protein